MLQMYHMHKFSSAEEHFREAIRIVTNNYRDYSNVQERLKPYCTTSQAVMHPHCPSPSRSQNQTFIVTQTKPQL